MSEGGVTRTESADGRRLARNLAGSGLFLCLILALGETVIGGRPGLAAVGAYLITLPLLVPFFRRQQSLFLAASVVSGLMLLWRERFDDLERALTQSVALAVLLVALVWLRRAATHSGELAEIARGVAQRGRAVRHLGLALSAHFTGILLNVGVFGVMAPLVAQADAAPYDKRDMAIAVLRGFGFTMLWAPTAAAQVVITSVVPGVTWNQIAPRAAAMAMSLILLSWMFSTFVHRDLPAQPAPRARLTLRPIVMLAGLIVAMMSLIIGLHVIGGYQLTGAVTVSALTVATTWMSVQALRGGESVAVRLGAHFSGYIGSDLARATPEVLTLGAAGFLGIAIAALIPPAWLDAVVTPLSDHMLILYLLITLLVPALSAFGVNPLVAASLIGGSFAAIPEGHMEPAKLAFALASGWGVAYGVSPFTTGAVVLAGTLGTQPGTITWRWNGSFSIVALIYACLVVAAVTLFT